MIRSETLQSLIESGDEFNESNESWSDLKHYNPLLNLEMNSMKAMMS